VVWDRGHMVGHDPFSQRGLVGTEDIINRDPGWRELSEGEASRQPYSAICQILVRNKFDGTTIATGTGWLAGRATVITAAHVVNFRNIRLEVRFRSAPFDRFIADDVQQHRDFALKDSFRPGFPHDVAAVRLPAGMDRRPLEIAQPVGAQVEVAGFPNRRGGFVTHVGAILRVERGYLSHLADTVEGHSGAPIMVQGRAVALHLGGFSINPFNNPGNTGLELSGEVRSFVNTAIQAWG
jgi:V8-like Glu-specific endopeptidase